MNITATFDGFFGMIHSVMELIRGLANTAPDYSVLILLGLSIAGSYFGLRYLYKNQPPVISGYWAYIVMAILIFLIVRFI